ncbi:hypothetical protein J4G43_026955 [Bradyrhizobium barranii subsp. barranii]|uniref:Uncharacterized protein n=1 Tax=Bradyrhizobium barranii subsp. barranii TaxID=2823807 RepID=A0A939MBD3_9BRAD|nr:hypothetical protein [Bradyrhizobium barranii]UEM08433.1 hypothetical protein J4G43_026955 [Bradyrhizobium barranii subsp. barranii]
MEGFGIVFQSIGAILLMYSQFEMNRTVSLWLQSLDLTVDQVVSGSDITRIRGIDKHWGRDLKWDRWLSLFGWLFFVGGYLLLIWHVVNVRE